MTVNITDDHGKVLAQAPMQQPTATTDVYDRMGAEADAAADHIIQANLSTGN